MAKRTDGYFTPAPKGRARGAGVRKRESTADVRTRIEQEQDRAIVAHGYLHGFTFGEMMKAVNAQPEIAGPNPTRKSCSSSTLWRDIDLLKSEWLKAKLIDFDEGVAIQLAKIDDLERTYWQAWDRSLQPAEEHSQEIGEIGVGREAVRRSKDVGKIKNRDGNPQFLQGVQWCIEQRSKLLGLNAPMRVQHEVDSTLRVWAEGEATRYGVDPEVLYQEARFQYIDLQEKQKALPPLIPTKVKLK